MAVRVLSTRETRLRHCFCEGCRAALEYLLEDIRSVTSYDYQGTEPTRESRVDCPNCKFATKVPDPL